MTGTPFVAPTQGSNQISRRRNRKRFGVSAVGAQNYYRPFLTSLESGVSLTHENAPPDPTMCHGRLVRT